MSLSISRVEPTLRRITQQKLLSCAPSTPIAEAARRMAEAHCSSILVEEQGRIIGIWTERDALALDPSDPQVGKMLISQLMSSPVKTLHVDTSLGEAAMRFREEEVRHFLVVDDGGGRLGIVSQSDVVINQGIEYYISLRELKSVFSRRLLLVPAAMPAELAMREMNQSGFDALIVERPAGEEASELGILTERDVVRLIGDGGRSRPVGEVASFPLITVPVSASLFEARQSFVEHTIRHLGVCSDAGELLGLITFSDILANIELEYVRQLQETLRRYEETLALSHKRLRLAACAFESTCEGILVTNAGQIIESVNPAFTAITGYRAEEAIGRKPSLLASGRHDQAFYAAMYAALAKSGHWQGELWNRRSNGEIYVAWLTIDVVKDDQDRVCNYVAVFSDITSRKAAEERLSFLAEHDALTRLPNRTLLDDRLVRAIAHAQRNDKMLAVVFLDLDDFKRVNDSIGHHAGDRVLQLVAQRLVGCVRGEDTVARLGGDEFVVLIEELENATGISEIVAKMRDSLAQPFVIDTQALSVRCSIGVSLYPQAGNTPEELLRQADAAMYRAKAASGAGNAAQSDEAKSR